MRLSKLGGPHHSVYQNGVHLNMSQHDECATVLKMIKTGHNIKYFEIKHEILYVKQKEIIFFRINCYPKRYKNHLLGF